jgi:hypothetical protein
MDAKTDADNANYEGFDIVKGNIWRRHLAATFGGDILP